MGGLFDKEGLEKRVKELELQMQETGFWDNNKRAEEVTKESSRIKGKLEKYNSLSTTIEDIEVLYELMDKDDTESAEEIISEITSLEKEVYEYKIEILLSGEYDRNDAIYIVRNRNGITAENLSYILKRNDIKKSDAYQSGFLAGTTPAYEAYLRLKKNLAASLK